MTDLLPLFVKLTGRAVLLVGGGRVAAGKLQQLLAAGADVRVVAPEMSAAIAEEDARGRVTLLRRAFAPSDLNDTWLVVAAATPDVNRAVAAAAEERRVFVNAVDDPPNASAYLSGVVRRDGVTIAISTEGAAPALTALLREGIDALLPPDLAVWMETARAERLTWRRDAVPMDERKPRLLCALNERYEDARLKARAPSGSAPTSLEREASAERVPWLAGPEDSWL